jgi:adenosine deaminase
VSWYEQLPKVELHVHLEGAIPHATMWQLIQKYGGAPAVPDPQALSDRFRYRNFSQFLDTWGWKNRFLREYDDFTLIAQMVARDLQDQNVRYAEMFFSPSLFIKHGLSIQPLTEAVVLGLRRVPGVEIQLIADLVRDYGPEREQCTLEQLSEVKHLGLLGIGIGGTEHEYPPEPFHDLYEKARYLGFRTTVHSGEAAGPEGIWAALRYLRPDRIGHGTTLLQDEALLNHLIRNRIPVEMCPVSNLRTGAIRSIADHPIRKCFLAGLQVSVNTDDPKMFDTSLADEYRRLIEEAGFSRTELCQLILLAIQSSWLPEDRKRRLADDFSQHPAWSKA